jgi:Ribonuclease G/E
LKVLKNFSRRKALKRSHFLARNLVPVIHKRIKDLRKVRLKRIFIQEDRDRAIASGLMKNTKFIPGASKAEEKVKGTKPKKKKTISNFFT